MISIFAFHCYLSDPCVVVCQSFACVLVEFAELKSGQAFGFFFSACSGCRSSLQEFIDIVPILAGGIWNGIVDTSSSPPYMSNPSFFAIGSCIPYNLNCLSMSFFQSCRLFDCFRNGLIVRLRWTYTVSCGYGSTSAWRWFLCIGHSLTLSSSPV